MNTSPMKRLSEIDSVRGLAIIGMLIFHFAFDLDFLGIQDIAVYDGGWAILRRTVQVLFLGTVGISIALSRRGSLGQLKRGAFIFSMGMLVTLATWIAIGEGFVKFGVLHFIGVAVPVVALFKGRPVWAILAAVGSALLGRYFFSGAVDVDSAWLFPLGLVRADFYSVDYFPIFPWLALPLLGLVFGEQLYRERKPRLEFIGRVPFLPWLGRHSLLIYLLHQPIFYGSLLLIFGGA